jgi:hypothetical protein
MAGLFDAEGCCTINSAFRKKSNCRGFTAQIIFTNTNLQLMKWVVKHFGGAIKKRKLISGSRQAYDWKVTNQKHALFFLSLIEPFLVVKKGEANILREYYALEGIENPDIRQRLLQRIKMAKQSRGSVTTEMPNILDSYLAGFVDGDGHIGDNFLVSVENTNQQVVRIFHQKYGGSLKHHQLSKRNPKWNDTWCWRLHGANALESVILSWLPYLIDKKLRANVLRVKIQSKLTGDRKSDVVGTLHS